MFTAVLSVETQWAFEVHDEEEKQFCPCRAYQNFRFQHEKKYKQMKNKLKRKFTYQKKNKISCLYVLAEFLVNSKYFVY